MFNLLPCAVVAWGVLAIGGVYPWAYYPLLCAAFVSGAYELWRERKSLGAGPERMVGLALLLLATATVIQLLPLPYSVRDVASPATEMILQQYVVGYSPRSVHSLSIDPDRTLVALMFIIALGVFLLGLIVRAGRRGVDELILTVTIVGAIIAALALVQRASGTDKVYGLWQPYWRTSVPFGPFVNRNHFAGWMLMALPLILGSAMHRLRSEKDQTGARAALVWLGSAEASWSVLIAGVAAIMGLALALTLSRSGAATLLLVVCLLCGALIVRGSRRTKVAFVYAIFLLAVAFGWGGTRELSARFAEANSSVRGRIAVWQDAARVAGAFPIAGTGLNTYGTAMLFFQRADRAHHYSQAHNDYLQIAAEGGVLVGVPALLLLAALGAGTLDSVRRSYLDSSRAGAIVAVIAILFQETADFSLQTPGNAILFCVVFAAAVRRSSSASLLPAVDTGNGWAAWYNTATEPSPRMRYCPSCRLVEIHRSKTRSVWENWRKALTATRPYRCHHCGWRGWGPDSGPRFPHQTVEVVMGGVVAAPPLARKTALTDESSGDINLEELDSLETKRH